MATARMTLRTAETLSSFLTTAAERFKDDAAAIRKEIAGKAHAGLEAIAAQFDRQEAEARTMAEQFADLYEVPKGADAPLIDPAPPKPDPGGKWRVMRDCCTSGNCVECRNVTPYGTPVRIVQGDGYSQERAEAVAANWPRYNAQAVREV